MGDIKLRPEKKRKHKGVWVETATEVKEKIGGDGSSKAKRRDCFKIEQTLHCQLCQKLLRNWMREAERESSDLSGW